jgi:hypothetical protein
VGLVWGLSEKGLDRSTKHMGRLLQGGILADLYKGKCQAVGTNEWNRTRTQHLWRNSHGTEKVFVTPEGGMRLSMILSSSQTMA